MLSTRLFCASEQGTTASSLPSEKYLLCIRSMSPSPPWARATPSALKIGATRTLVEIHWKVIIRVPPCMITTRKRVRLSVPRRRACFCEGEASSGVLLKVPVALVGAVNPVVASITSHRREESTLRPRHAKKYVRAGITGRTHNTRICGGVDSNRTSRLMRREYANRTPGDFTTTVKSVKLCQAAKSGGALRSYSCRGRGDGFAANGRVGSLRGCGRSCRTRNDARSPRYGRPCTHDRRCAHSSAAASPALRGQHRAKMGRL